MIAGVSCIFRKDVKKRLLGLSLRPLLQGGEYFRLFFRKLGNPTPALNSTEQSPCLLIATHLTQSTAYFVFSVGGTQIGREESYIVFSELWAEEGLKIDLGNSVLQPGFVRGLVVVEK